MPSCFLLQVFSVERSLKANHMANAWYYLACTCQWPIGFTAASDRWTCRLKDLLRWLSILHPAAWGTSDTRSITSGSANCFQGKRPQFCLFVSTNTDKEESQCGCCCELKSRIRNANLLRVVLSWISFFGAITSALSSSSQGHNFTIYSCMNLNIEMILRSWSEVTYHCGQGGIFPPAKIQSTYIYTVLGCLYGVPEIRLLWVFVGVKCLLLVVYVRVRG